LITSLRHLPLWTLTLPAAMTLALVAEPSPWVRAQANALEGVEIPTTLPDGTTLNINSSEAMRLVNEALRSRFAQQYDTTDIEVNYQSADDAVQALIDGNTDLAAVGRNLTEAEIQQGLTQLDLARPKIAIITSPDNPFSGSLTIDQFAQIFRGDITNWSEVGGPDAPIVLVDRPAISDTRQAFRSYPVFQNAPFEAASGAVSLDADNIEAVIDALDANAISYAVADQVQDNAAVKIVPMHNTLPSDPRYPFSQPLSYVYRETDPSPAALAFLGYALDPDNEAVIEAARTAQALPDATATADADAEATPETETEVAPDPEAASEDELTTDTAAPEAETAAPSEVIAQDSEIVVTGRDRGVPWWPWILALPVLGGLLWWLLKDRTPAAAPLVATEPERRIILTPRDCRDAYAYWELPPGEIDALKRQNCSLALRLHDVTGIEDVDQQPPHSMTQFASDTVAQGDLHIPISVDNRDYLVELGYLDNQESWHALARSEVVRVPACPSTVPTRSAGVGAAAKAAGLTAAGAVAASTRPAASASAAQAVSPEPARIILTPRDCRHAYAYWELPADQVQTIEANSWPLKLRLYDVTALPGANGTNVNSMQEFDGSLSSPGDRHLPVPIDNRDYRVELGYVGTNQQWHSLAKSEAVRVPACVETSSQPLENPSPVASPAASALSRQDERPQVAATGPIGELQNRAADVANPLQHQESGVMSKAPDVAEIQKRGVAGLMGVTAAAGAAAAGVASKARSSLSLDAGTSQSMPGSGAGVRSDLGAESRIILVPRDADSAYAYWEIAPAHRQQLKDQGGRTMALRIHDATNLELDYQAPHGTQEYVCRESDQDKHVPIPTPDRDYVAELGYLTEEGQWLRLLRSLHVRVG
jgi:phosphate transport system substrate-binding protein